MSALLPRALRAALRRGRRALRRTLSPHALVLNYHRIAEPTAADHWALCVGATRFAEQLEVLRQVAEVVPLGAIGDCARRRGARPVVALTFDDGYADGLRAALPALERWGMPGTFFIATEAIGSDAPYWWDRLGALIACGGASPALHAELWTMEPAARDDALAALESRLADAPRAVAGLPLSLAELSALARSPLVEIGAHSLGHRHLPSLSPAAQSAEIAGSRQALREMLGRAPESFAYPYGALDELTPGLVRDAGFARACTTQAELWWAGGDLLRIPRFAVGDWDGAAFERRLRQEWLP